MDKPSAQFLLIQNAITIYDPRRRSRKNVAIIHRAQTTGNLGAIQ